MKRRSTSSVILEKVEENIKQENFYEDIEYSPQIRTSQILNRRKIFCKTRTVNPKIKKSGSQPQISKYSTVPSKISSSKDVNLINALHIRRRMLESTTRQFTNLNYKFEENFRNKYADIQYRILSAKACSQENMINNKETFQDQVKELQLSSRAQNKNTLDPISNAIKLVENFKKLKNKGYYTINANKYKMNINILNKEFLDDLEHRTFHLTNKFQQGKKKESPEKNSKNNFQPIKREINEPQLSHFVGSGIKIFIDNKEVDFNQTQKCTQIFFYRNMHFSACDIFKDPRRMIYLHGCDINMANAQLYGKWKIYETTGDFPGSNIGTLLPYGSAFIYYSEDISTGMVALYYIYLQELNWARRISNYLDNIPRLDGENVHLVDNSKIVAYGGVTKYLHQNMKINPRTSVRIFDLRYGNEIVVYKKQQDYPKARRGHASCIADRKLWVFGGLALGSDKYLNDLWVFNIDDLNWTRVKLKPKIDNFDPEGLVGHSMTAVFNQKLELNNGKLQNLDLCSNEKLNQYLMGFYVFGGTKQNGKETNELFLIRPHPRSTGSHCILDETLLECVKPNIIGKPPLPRSEHNASFIENKYIVIYGGTNNSIKSITGSRCVNDIMLLNIHIYQWEILASYGEAPEGRWNSSLYSMNNKIIIFGGYTESEAVDNNLYMIDIISAKEAKNKVLL